jgi:hypothetical protein
MVRLGLSAAAVKNDAGDVVGNLSASDIRGGGHIYIPLIQPSRK